jgi:hypothetical protein
MEFVHHESWNAFGLETAAQHVCFPRITKLGDCYQHLAVASVSQYGAGTSKWRFHIVLFRLPLARQTDHQEHEPHHQANG